MIKQNFFSTVLLFFLGNALSAATIQSKQTGNWNTATTWLTNAVPNSNDDVVIATGNNVTIDDIGTTIYCKSLTVNGKLIYENAAVFQISNYNDRTGACIVNGTFEYSVGYGFTIYGYLKFNTGSTFKMPSGGLTIDGALGAVTSVPAGQPLLDVTNIGTLDVFRSTIFIRNPHYDAATPSVKGAKRFGNTIAFGSGNTPDVPTDFTVSETDKPTFSYLELNFAGTNNRFKATNIQIDSSVSIIAGALYNYSTATPIYVKGDFNVKQGVTVTGNIEFNGTLQQNINPHLNSGATLVTFNGDIIVNNPMFVKSKINMTIQGGDLKFILGRFDTEQKTLSLERPPVNSSPNRYVITYDYYQDIGFLLIKNLAGNTLFPIGTHYSYAPVSINAASGNFKASVTPLIATPSVPTNYEYVNLTWNIGRVSGSATADVTLQWEGSQENGGFPSYRNLCKMYNTNVAAWSAVTSVGGTNSTNGTVYTKTATNVSTFSSFSIFAPNSLVPVELSQFSGKKQDNRGLLTWTTVSEIGNLGFEIQKNTEGGRGFETIGFVKGQGNTQTLTDYVFWDDNFNQTAYYRLKQVDNSGKQSFSKIISIENGSAQGGIAVFPTKIGRGDILTIQVADNADADNIQVEIFNANGQKVGQQKGATPIQTDSWTRGIYFVKIVKKTEVMTFKVMSL